MLERKVGYLLSDFEEIKDNIFASVFTSDNLFMGTSQVVLT